MSNNEDAKKIQQDFIAKAKSQGITVYKNNIRDAKPLNKVCGSIKTDHPASLRELICGR